MPATAFAEDVDAGDAGDAADAALDTDAAADVVDDVTDADADAGEVSDADAAADVSDVVDAVGDVDSDAADARVDDVDVREDVGTGEDTAVDVGTDVAADDVSAAVDAATDAELTDVQTDVGGDAGSDVAADAGDDAASDAAADSGEPAELVTVTGLVRLRQIFDVQREVTVSLGEGSGAPFVTGLSGEPFEWVDVPSGRATVVAVAPGFGPSSTTVELAEGATFEVLLYPTAPVALSGRLVLPDGNAAAGATVTLSGRDQVAGEEFTAVAGADGAFGWFDVLPGVYRLSANSAEASFVSERWEILAGGEVVIVLVDNASRTPFEETGCSSVPAGRAGGAWWLAVISGLAWLRRRSFAA